VWIIYAIAKNAIRIQTGRGINIFSQPHEKVSKWFVNFNTRCGFIRNTQLHVNGNVQESNKKQKTKTNCKTKNSQNKIKHARSNAELLFVK